MLDSLQSRNERLGHNGHKHFSYHYYGVCTFSSPVG